MSALKQGYLQRSNDHVPNGQASSRPGRLAPLVCFLLVAISILPAYADKPPASVFGDYTGFAGKSKPGTYLPTKKSDRVRILRDAGSDARVTITLTVDKGQVCELEGNAVWADGQLTIRVDGLDETKPCQLVLRLKGAVLTLHDVKDRCREVYCGTRGAFEGAQFKKKL